MGIPVLDFQVQYPSEMVGVISLTPPFNWVDIKIRCNEHIKTFLARITFEDEVYGKDKGLEFAYDTDLTSGDFHNVVDFLHPAPTGEPQHSLVADGVITMTQGDGQYRIGLYVQNDDDVWNEYFILVTTESDGSSFRLLDKEDKQLYVLDKGVL